MMTKISLMTVVLNTLAIAALVGCAPDLPSTGVERDNDSDDDAESASTKKGSSSKTKTPSKTSSSSSGGTESSTSSSSGGVTPTPTTPAPSSSSGGSGACSASADQSACYQCCETQNPAATDIFLAALDACLCQSPGACKTQCAGSICGGNAEPSAECETCMEAQNDTCGQQAATACESNPACTPLFQCEEASGCAAKAQ